MRPRSAAFPLKVTVEEASDAGQMTMEHMIGMTAACESTAKAQAVFAKLKANHTWQCPTLTVMRIIDCLGNPAGTNDERLRFIPAYLRDYWLDRMTKLDSKPLTEKPNRQKAYRRNLELVGAMQHAGVDILAGTDTGESLLQTQLRLQSQTAQAPRPLLPLDRLPERKTHHQDPLPRAGSGMPKTNCQLSNAGKTDPSVGGSSLPRGPLERGLSSL